MSDTLLLPRPKDSWISGVCHRFSHATGWTLRYQPSAANEDCSRRSTPPGNVIWQANLNTDEGPQGRLFLSQNSDQIIEEEFHRIRALAELIAELIAQNEIAEGERDQRARELETLVDVGRSRPGEADLPTELERLVAAAVQLTDFRSAAFFLLDPSGGKLSLTAEFHSEERTIPFPIRDLKTESPDFPAMQIGRVSLSADDTATSALWLPRGIATGVVLKVRIDDHPAGTLWAYDRRHRDPDAREWHVLESISAQISARMERSVLQHESLHEHRLREDVKMASAHHSGGIFENLPGDRRFETAGFCTSRYELGGDLCEAIPLDEHRTAIILGDACGDSVPAALVMSAIRGAVHSLVRPDDPTVLQTSETMVRLNQALYNVTPSHQFMSLIYLVIDSENHTITYTNAGHPSPIFLHDGQPQELQSHGVLAGVLEDATYEQGRLMISPDDVLVLFSDGITEAMSDRCTLFRSRGILDTAKDCYQQSAQGILDAITERLSVHTGGVTDDDRTLVVLKFK